MTKHTIGEMPKKMMKVNWLPYFSRVRIFIGLPPLQVAPLFDNHLRLPLEEKYDLFNI